MLLEGCRGWNIWKHRLQHMQNLKREQYNLPQSQYLNDNAIIIHFLHCLRKGRAHNNRQH